MYIEQFFSKEISNELSEELYIIYLTSVANFISYYCEIHKL